MTSHKEAAQDPFSWVNSSGRVGEGYSRDLAGLWLAGPYTKGLGIWESVEETGGKLSRWVGRLSICVFCRENVSGQPSPRKEFLGNREPGTGRAAFSWQPCCGGRGLPAWSPTSCGLALACSLVTVLTSIFIIDTFRTKAAWLWEAGKCISSGFLENQN